MPRIFISYRREDSQVITGRIHSDLIREFQTHNVFFDRYNIPAGIDFRQYLKTAILESEVVLVVIGKLWVDIKEEGTDRRRLEDPEDFVRLEIRTALEAGKLIIPILVDGAAMPRSHQLPEDIRDFSFRNAIGVRHDPDYPRDMSDVIKRVRSPKTTGTTSLFRPIGRFSPLVYLVVIVLLLLAIPFLMRYLGIDLPAFQSTATEEETLIVQASAETVDVTSLASTETPTMTLAPSESPTDSPSPTNTPLPTETATEAPAAIGLDSIDAIAESAISPLLGHSANVRRVAYTPDGQRLISASEDGQILIWDSQTGALLKTIDFDVVFGLSIDPQGRFFAAAGASVPVVWDLSSYEEIARLRRHDNTVFGLQFSQDGSRLVSGDGSGMIVVWNTETWTMITTFEGHSRVSALAFPAQGQSFLSDGWDGYLRYWSLNNFTKVNEILIRADLQLHDLASHPSESLVAIASNDAYVRLWDYNSNALSTLRPENREHNDAVLALAFNRDGQLLLAGDRYGEVLIWNLDEQVVLRRFNYRTLYNVPAQESIIYGLAFSPDNRSFAVASGDNKIRIFSLP